MMLKNSREAENEMLERSSGFARDTGEKETVMGWKSDTGKRWRWRRGLLESMRVVEQEMLAKKKEVFKKKQKECRRKGSA